MSKNLIDHLNKILTNTLEYHEVLSNLSESVSHQSTKDKLGEFATVMQEESETLMQVIPEVGGDIESTTRQTDQEAVGWVPRPLPKSSNMKSILTCLIKAERNKEDGYHALFSHQDISRETKNRLDKHCREAEANLTYFQTALQTLENKSSN